MWNEVQKYDAGLQLVAVVDPAEDRLKETFAERLDGVIFYPDVDAMLDGAEPDGVMIGTTCNFHTPYAMKVLARNIPLFLEKPVAINEDQLTELEQAMNGSTSGVVVSFPLRLSSLVEMAKERIDSGVIGTVEHVQAINNVPFYGSNYFHGWMRNEDLTGGLWLQKATHDLDYLNYLIGRPPVRMFGVESKTVFTGDMPAGLYCLECPINDTCPESQKNLFYMQGILDDMHDAEGWWDGRWQCSFAVDTGNHDAATAILQYESGMHAVYTQNFYARRGAARRGATLIGYKGTVTFDWYSGEVTVYHHQTPRVERLSLDATGGHFGGDKELAHDFVQIVLGKGESRATLVDGIRSARLCLMAKRSCQTGASVPYPEPVLAAV